MHGVEASAMEAERTQEARTIRGSGLLWEFCFSKEPDFHLHPLHIFGKHFLVLMDPVLLEKLIVTVVNTNASTRICVYLYVSINIGLFAFAGVHYHVGMLVFTHCITYQSQTPEISPGVFIFLPY